MRRWVLHESSNLMDLRGSRHSHEVVEAESDTVRIVDEDKLGRIYPLPSEDPKATCSVYLSCAKNLDSSQLTASLRAGIRL